MAFYFFFFIRYGFYRQIFFAYFNPNFFYRRIDFYFNPQKIKFQKFDFLFVFFAVLIAFSFSLIIFYYSFHAKNMDAEGIVSQLDNNYPKKFPAAAKAFLNQTAKGDRFKKPYRHTP